MRNCFEYPRYVLFATHVVELTSILLIYKIIYILQMQCIEDEYVLDGELFTLEYRTVDSDISLLNGQFQPQG